MSNSKFSVEEIVTNSWFKFKQEFIFWIGITLLSLIVSSLGNISIILTVVSMYFSASISLMYINYMRHKEVSINDLNSVNFTTFMHYICVNICCGAAVILGLVFFILPGLYLATRFMFAQYLVVDKHKSFDDAIKISWEMTKGEEVNLFAFILAMFLLIIVGACTFLVGLLVAIPMAGLSSASLYLVFTQDNYNNRSIEDESIHDINFE